MWLSVQRTIQLAIATDCSFVCLNISPVASKGKALKEEWISYICHEVLNVSLQENLHFSNSINIIIVNVCRVVKIFNILTQFLDNNSPPSTKRKCTGVIKVPLPSAAINSPSSNNLDNPGLPVSPTFNNNFCFH